MNILMLEDDPAIAQGLRYSLESEGYTVTHCATVTQALEAVGAGRFDLCLLDLTLPDGSGYDVCKAIKAKDDTPVIFLTAFDDEVNVVMGLELGADDYISKPFRLRELMARIKTGAAPQQGRCHRGNPYKRSDRADERGQSAEKRAGSDSNRPGIQAVANLFAKPWPGAQPQYAAGEHLGCGRRLCQRQHAERIHQAVAGEDRGRPGGAADH